ncbi:hypothetical protein [Pseudonocardia sp. T1-2H]|uniref:hypothetical protein n=1 Tax=Pseudonocardia sp. T1-2H TaxID=3128899 RepID=UPI0031018403
MMTSVAELLRFAALQGWAPTDTAGLLAMPRQLRQLPTGFVGGEHGQWGRVALPTFRLKAVAPAVEVFTDAQLGRLFDPEVVSGDPSSRPLAVHPDEQPLQGTAVAVESTTYLLGLRLRAFGGPPCPGCHGV